MHKTNYLRLVFRSDGVRQNRNHAIEPSPGFFVSNVQVCM